MRTTSIFTLALALAALSPTSGLAREGTEAPSISLQGRCDYGDKVTPYADGSNGFTWCDSVVIAQDGEQTSFDFRRESWGSMVRYEGELSGDTMRITRVHVRDRPAEAARGQCIIYRANGRISTVTCVANARQLAWAANFIPRY
jgi:hypothetical protein